MAKMIPPFISPNAPPGEKKLFHWLSDFGDPEWIAFHDQHVISKTDRETQVDFIVVVPGIGVLVIEVKSHSSVSMSDDGQWVLGKQPWSRSPDEQARTAQHVFFRRLKETMRPASPNFPIVGTIWFTHTDFPQKRIDASQLKTLVGPLDQRNWANPRAAILSTIEQGKHLLVENRQKGTFQWSALDSERPNRYDIEHIKGALLPLKSTRIGHAIGAPRTTGGGLALDVATVVQPPPSTQRVRAHDYRLPARTSRVSRKNRRLLILVSIMAFCVVAATFMLVLAVDVAFA